MREFRKLFEYTAGSRARLAVGMICRTAELVLSVFLMAGLIGDAVFLIQSEGMAAVVFLTLRLLPGFTAVMCLHIAGEYLTEQAAQQSAARMRGDFLNKLLEARMDAVYGLKGEQVLAVFSNDIQAAFTNLTQVLQVPANALALGGSGLAYIISMHWSMGILVLMIGFWQLAYSLILSRRMRKISDRLILARGETCLWMESVLEGIETVRMDRLGGVAQEKYEKACLAEQKKAVAYGSLSGLIGGLNNTNGQFLEKGSIFLSGLLAAGGQLGISQVVQVSQLSGQVAQVLNVSRILTDTQMSVAGTAKVFGMMDGLLPEQPGQEAGAGGEPEIVLEHVAFSYQPGKPVWQDLNLKLRAGEIAVLAGESGGGKSTLLRLLLALYLPDSGRILINGADTRDWDRKALRKLIAYVPQKPVLFPGTVAENIMAGWNRDAEGARRAAKLAQIDEVIRKLPKGYETRITGGSGCFSGGELQRLALARAVYRNAPVWLLDEPSSALDSRNEEELYRCLESSREGKIILISTHRASAERIADRVVRAEGGKIWD